MTISEAQKRAHEKYFKENYSQVKLSMPNDETEALAAYCAEHGYTKAGFIRQAIKEKMEREEMDSVAIEYMIHLYNIAEAIQDENDKDCLLKAMWFFIKEYGVPDAGIVFERRRDGRYQAHIPEIENGGTP